MTPSPLDCPFCGAPETDRFTLEGRRFLVFRCLFTAETDPSVPEASIAETIRSTYGPLGPEYFRRQCDALHRYVTKGAGAAELTRRGAVRTAVP
ncbi:MAG TPA: hypothetical protein VGV64_00245 [Thermoplasmata archaeon]|nr:hypothetical protein [Thermoplasmata archaeon]